MTVFSYHLVKLPFFSAIHAILFPVRSVKIPGLIHAETMSVMVLGSPIFSSSRFFSRKIAVFAQWENESALNDFMSGHPFGLKLSAGWHLRLEFIRQWGAFSGYKIPAGREAILSAQDPVVAVTIARMKYSQIPRFLRWGRPVEKLVRDHSGTSISLASIRYPNTISTFSIWKSQVEMTDMVFGHNRMPQPKRHFDAMKEQSRKDFHFEFTTLRFRPLAEYGEWERKRNLIPQNSKHT
jgi:hypothetical protein